MNEGLLVAIFAALGWKTAVGFAIVAFLSGLTETYAVTIIATMLLGYGGSPFGHPPYGGISMCGGVPRAYDWSGDETWQPQYLE